MQVPYMLQYFHQRGKVVYFDGEDTLSRLVVINPTWLISVVGRLLEVNEGSQATVAQLADILQDKELDRQLLKANISVTSTEWLLSALQRLEVGWCTVYLNLIDPLPEYSPPSDWSNEFYILFPIQQINL
jgi:UDP-N-acetylmuramyl pentapeptide synthase